MSRRVRRDLPDLTSPLTKSASRQLFIRNPQEARSARASATSYLRETRSKPHDFKGKLPRHCAATRSRVLKSTPHHHSSHALRRHARAKSLGLRSPPHSSTTITATPKSPSFLTRLRNHTPFDARLVSRWLGFFRQAGRRSRCCVEPRGPVIDHVRFSYPADRRDPRAPI